MRQLQRAQSTKAWFWCCGMVAGALRLSLWMVLSDVQHAVGEHLISFIVQHAPLFASMSLVGQQACVLTGTLCEGS